MKIFSFIIVLFICVSCKKEKGTPKNNVETTSFNDSLYTLNPSFKTGDVRRYGVVPGKGIGQHPKLLKDKLEVLLDIAEKGVALNFPEGIYNRTLYINNRKNVEIISNNAIFTGTINIKKSNKIKIKGTIETLLQFVTNESEDLDFENIIIRSDTLLSGNGKRSGGCSIHAGTKDVKINKLIVKDVGSGPDGYKYVKGGLVVHGHNNEPQNIIIDTVLIESSDRHGVYLTGEAIDVNYMHIKKFGIGSGEKMAPMEGGVEGEQVDFSGLWIKNAFNSYTRKAVIDLSEAKGKYSINFDVGESFRPYNIDSLIIIQSGDQKPVKRILSRTGVVVGELNEN